MSNPSNILLIGGSGFLSGTVARLAVAQGHKVWAITRGQRPMPKGVTPITADRRDTTAFSQAIESAGIEWDLVIDGIAYDPEHAQQDISVFRNKTPHLIFVSTDFVFNPAHRTFPQTEETDHYLPDGYGGKKRLCELEFLNDDTQDMNWTVVRPCHIYGPGSKLGCLPKHGRDDHILDRIRSGESLQLVGAGHFLQQPILARDLADLMLSMCGNTNTHNQIYCAAGPDIIESSQYYNIIADILGVNHPLIQEIPVTDFLTEHPGQLTFCCHRIYSLDKLKESGAKAPSTPITQGLKEHVESLLQ
jgi:nucleoside-diphosphate-sugar epimerase